MNYVAGMNMQKVFFLLATLMMSLAVQAQQAKATSESEVVERFVNAIRYVAIYKAQAKGFLANAKAPINQDDAKFQAFMRRVTQTPEDALRPHFVKVMQKYISPTSAIALAEFYESPIGKKISTLSVMAAEKLDISSVRNELQLTSQEKAEMVSFTQASAYREYTQAVIKPEFARELMRSLVSAPEFSDLNLNVAF